MFRGLYTASTGMRAQELSMDVIANNLANVNTFGYKSDRAEFQTLMSQYILEPGAPTSQTTLSPTGIYVGLGVKTSGVSKQFTQGDFTSTGNELDVSIEGDGFFEVLLPDGTSAYTRAGNLKLDSNGQIVTTDGYVLNPAITIPSDALSITIGQDGTVSVRQPGNATPSQVGQIQGARFANNAGLKSIGRNLFQETESSGTATTGNFNEDGLGTLSQGFLESSNVSIVEEIVKMIAAQKGYEVNSKAIQTSDDMVSQAINLKR